MADNQRDRINRILEDLGSDHRVQPREQIQESLLEALEGIVRSLKAIEARLNGRLGPSVTEAVREEDTP